jgi:epoxyqueuosine reductase
MQRQITEIIKKHLLPAENYIYGFAGLTGLLNGKFDGFNYGISVGRKLDDAIVDDISDGPAITNN